MPLDYNSLLVAVGFAATGLAVTMFGSWLSSRADSFLLTWAVGVALVVTGVFSYSVYVASSGVMPQLLAFALLLGGFSLLLGAARQFRLGKLEWPLVAGLALASALSLLPSAALGLDGVTDIVFNLAAGALLIVTGHQYWQGRAEAPAPSVAITALYVATGLSFAICAVVLAANGQWVLGHAPHNWSENVNTIVGIAGVTGIGALSLALNQSRLARSHVRDAMTDPLTGLMNRRALFKQVGGAPVDRFTGVLLFDLDRFKSVNDEFGHSVGDEVIRRFAEAMNECLRGSDLCARLGGEEFVAVLPGTTTDRAHQIAERIRRAFAEVVVETERGSLKCTVSVGIAFPTADRSSFEQVLADADRALYRAKHTGRNRIASSINLRLAG
jgi:diguanylate cyclase (GGDEF)-like protein